MNRLRIRHHTGFRYDSEVAASYNEARMLPASSGDGQLVLYSNLEILPITSHQSYIDYWGSRVTAFEVLSPHAELALTATSLVEVRARGFENGTLGWGEVADAATTSVGFVEQQKQTRLTEPTDDLVELAREIAGRHPVACDAALEIVNTIAERMEYVQGVTGVQSTARDAWAERKGVCQDIAHVSLGALRALGIPARYVSGYLHPDPDAAPGQTVAGESHAWVEWFGGVWRGFDPTNQQNIGNRHVIVGRGRDYNDVAPLRGVYAGSAASELFVKVEITEEP